MSWNLLGHDWAVSMLQRDLATDRLRHAYLFTGPTGIGKRTLVHEFTRALLCEPPGPGLFGSLGSPTEPPCGQCRHCQLMSKGAHSDALTVQPIESGKKVRSAKIKIDQMRQLIYDLNLRPVEARRRVARVLRFEAANVESQNAFLKTLEEPPPGVIILLTAERADDLLPTIVSRCEVLNLRPLPRLVVQEALQTRWQVPAEKATLLAHLAQGRLGWAVRMQGDEEALADRAQRLDDITTLLAGTRTARFAYAEQLARGGSLDQVQDTLDVWLSLWRDILLTAAQAAAPLSNPDREAEVQRLAAALQPAAVAHVIQQIHRTSSLLERNVNSRLALEVMLLEWPRVGGGREP